MMTIRYGLGLFLVLLLTGCTPKSTPLTYYTLEAGHVQPVTHSPYRNRVLKVSYPMAIKEKITDKMLFSYSFRDSGTYQNSQWSNNLGKLLEGIIIAALEESRLFKAVLPYASTVNANYRLEPLIYDFSHHIRGNASYAVVSIQFSLIDINTGKLLKTKRFSYREPTPTVDANGYAEATNKIMTRMVHDLVLWLK